MLAESNITDPVELTVLNNHAEHKWEIFLASFLESLELSGETLEDYFVDLHEEGFATSTLWTNYSMIDAYFTHQLKKNLTVQYTSTRRLFKQWQKSERTKQSLTFTVEQIVDYITNASHTGKHLSNKIVAIMSLFGVLRKTELQALEYDHLNLKDLKIFSLVKPFARKEKAI